MLDSCTCITKKGKNHLSFNQFSLLLKHLLFLLSDDMLRKPFKRRLFNGTIERFPSSTHHGNRVAMLAGEEKPHNAKAQQYILGGFNSFVYFAFLEVRFGVDPPEKVRLLARPREAVSSSLIFFFFGVGVRSSSVS